MEGSGFHHRKFLFVCFEDIGGNWVQSFRDLTAWVLLAQFLPALLVRPYHNAWHIVDSPPMRQKRSSEMLNFKYSLQEIRCQIPFLFAQNPLGTDRKVGAERRVGQSSK